MKRGDSDRERRTITRAISQAEGQLTMSQPFVRIRAAAAAV
jgi:hypothetical protein